MITKSLWFGPLLCLALTQAASDDKATKDLERMQGTWVMHALEIDGKDLAADKFQNTLLIVKKDEYRTKVKDNLLPGFRIKLDPGKNPKAIDMIQTMPDGSEKTVKGIYTFENDIFKLARGLTAEQERPNQFATWPNTSYFVVTWKKQPK